MTAPVRRYVDYLRVEQVGGLVLLVAAAIALVLANSPASDWYEDLRGVTFGPDTLGARLDVAHWASDGLLAVFFFVVGLEVKRELVIGELTDRRTAALPVIAALGGIVVPALVYLAVAGGAPGSGRGWAVPTATDIAFALAVLAVAGAAAPVGLRLFLLSLAVVDDLGAIALIAALYTETLRLLPLLGAAALLGLYWLAQRRRITTPLLYVPLAIAAWLCVHDSGVHATVAGVAFGLLTRVRPDDGEEHGPAERLEHRLQPWSAGLVVPVFAFTAAGVSVSTDAFGAALDDRAAVAVLVALLLGKFLGVLGASWLAVRTGLARLPERVGWVDLAGVAALAGTGFTVSLLLARLAFPEPERGAAVTLAVLVASVVASVVGAVILRIRRHAHAHVV
ncbi:MAG: Na+/H+ antiporter NhaA [Frankiaceae bacterium]|nr:Na+/H+ antiporter NhaA [Frankiaceae bacterium]